MGLRERVVGAICFIGVNVAVVPYDMSSSRDGMFLRHEALYVPRSSTSCVRHSARKGMVLLMFVFPHHA